MFLVRERWPVWGSHLKRNLIPSNLPKPFGVDKYEARRMGRGAQSNENAHGSELPTDHSVLRLHIAFFRLSSLRTLHCFHVVLTHTFAGHDIFNFPSGNSEFSKKNQQETCRTDQVQVTTTWSVASSSVSRRSRERISSPVATTHLESEATGQKEHCHWYLLLPSVRWAWHALC